MDLQKCFDVLKQHAPSSGDACCAPGNAPADAGGQIIDLETGVNESSAEAIMQRFPALCEPQEEAPGEGKPGESSAPAPVSAPAEYPAMDVDAESCGKCVAPDPEAAKFVAAADAESTAREAWRRLAAADLILKVLDLHAERVQVHKAFDGAIDKLLGQGVGAVAREYPTVVALATRRFSGISARVRAAAAEFEARAKAKRPPAGEDTASLSEAGQLVRRVQGLEKQRLELTAARHLERSRILALSGGVVGSASDGEAAAFAASGDGSAEVKESGELLCARRNLEDFRKRVGRLDSEIEETISELRCCRADLMSD
eukprot:TRINITY_DN55289_c0_g1_i1.p1 TRINITY_DN55289_c0_g1~~TRINITY_DN55289_c0_g1_i1.p1  ORF type:complete len:315 (-),score=80.36 TRINITY_DN55289_c0_g1_i1:57-1001(-)